MQKNIIILIIKKKVLFCGLPPYSRSLLPKIDELSILSPHYRSDIAVIARTWLRPDVSSELNYQEI